jgi:hypothetical protein
MVGVRVVVFVAVIVGVTVGVFPQTMMSCGSRKFGSAPLYVAPFATPFSTSALMISP